METDLAERVEAPPSFEEFFDAHRARLFGALCLMTRDRHEAEEIVQEAFARVWEHWNGVGNRISDPTGYLFRIATNLFRQRLRRAALAARRTIHVAPRDDLAEIDANDAVMRLLARLTRKQRAAVVLVDLLDFPAPEAARLLGIRAGAVRGLLHRARTALREGTGGTE
jgi:RNA polymerase sigma factor (sigma-70 family)